MMLPLPVILGDVGGTFARFAVLSEHGRPEVLLAKAPTASHRTIITAIRDALRQHRGAPPRSAIIAAAGPLSRGAVHLTNANWTIDPAVIGQELELDEVVLTNDYTATAAALPGFCRDGGGALRIGSCDDRAGAQLVLGPGTGLGAAALLPFGRTRVIQATEAGHVEFGPVSEREFRIWPLLERVHGRITAEALLSGAGVVRLYRAVAAVHRAAAPFETPAAIIAGWRGGDRIALEALHLFVTLLGRFAGDLALIFGANGGVFIAGGIAPRIEPLFTHGGAFRAAFEHKAPFEGTMRLAPTYLIMRAEPVLAGLSAIAADRESFLMRAAHWRAGSR